MIMSVGHHQMTVPIKRQAGGASLIRDWCLPGSQELAVTFEYLDSCRQIDDEQLIVVADGDRARFVKASLRVAVSPNRQLGRTFSRLRRSTSGQEKRELKQQWGE